MTLHTLALATRTHSGLARSRNEDNLAADAVLGLAVLADGMGGHRGGAVASRLAVETVVAGLTRSQQVSRADDTRSQTAVGQALETANRAVFDTASARPELAGMGTTAVAAVFRDEHVYYAHVGDSRLYRVRYGRLRRLTRDHSLIQHMIDDGVFMNRRHAREAGVKDNVLMRSLGVQREVGVDVGGALLEPGDTYLLSSDGLHGCVPDTAIARILRSPGEDLEVQAQALLDAALAAGGPDNISLVLARPELG